MGFYGAAQVARIHRHFLHLKSGKASDETVLAITGLLAGPEVKANGETLLEVARGQWSIENGNHYVRDRSYDEDRCQVREPPLISRPHPLSTVSATRTVTRRSAG